MHTIRIEQKQNNKKSEIQKYEEKQIKQDSDKAIRHFFKFIKLNCTGFS